MLEAGFWGMIAASSLFIGALIGIYVKVPQKIVSFIMALGSGVLLSSVAFELMEEAFKAGGLDASIIGMSLGAVMFFTADYIISYKGGHHRKKSKGTQTESEDSSSSNAIFIGSLMDGIPESLALGIGMIHGGKVSLSMLIAVFISNIPESLSSASGMIKSGHSKPRILFLWFSVLVASGLSAMLGYKFLVNSSGNLTGGIQSFAAGAILTMVSSTMLPEAYETSGPLVGLLTSLGFLISFILTFAK